MNQKFYLDVYPEKTENKCSNKNLHTHVYGSAIHSHQKVERTQMFVNREMDNKLWRISIQWIIIEP